MPDTSLMVLTLILEIVAAVEGATYALASEIKGNLFAKVEGKSFVAPPTLRTQVASVAHSSKIVLLMKERYPGKNLRPTLFGDWTEIFETMCR